MAPSAVSPRQRAADVTAQQPSGNFTGYDHVTWWVGNAKQAAAYYTNLFGFRAVAYRGLETGSRYFASYVVANNDVRFVFTLPLRSAAHLPADEPISDAQRRELVAMHAHLERHGDAVKDVAFEVDDFEAVFDRAVKGGAVAVQAPEVLRDAEHGCVVTAVVETYGGTTHTLIQRGAYAGPFLPGYRAAGAPTATTALPDVALARIDHCVGNQDWHDMASACAFYEQCLSFHRFWSVDDSQICTDFSALNSVLWPRPTTWSRCPSTSRPRAAKRSQIEEYVVFNAGPGVQHVALLTRDICAAVAALRARGVDFIRVPASYYDALRRRLKMDRRRWELREDLATLERLSILIDYDEAGYLLPFTKPLMDRPTVFIEIIQRHDFDGFGAGNFKSLFEAIERDQADRGNL